MNNYILALAVLDRVPIVVEICRKLYACNYFYSYMLSMKMSETLLHLLKKFEHFIPNFY